MIPLNEEILNKHKLYVANYPSTKQALSAMDEYAKEILKAALSNHAEVSLGMIVDDNGTYSDIEEYYNNLQTLKP